MQFLKAFCVSRTYKTYLIIHSSFIWVVHWYACSSSLSKWNLYLWMFVFRFVFFYCCYCNLHLYIDAISYILYMAANANSITLWQQQKRWNAKRIEKRTPKISSKKKMKNHTNSTWNSTEQHHVYVFCSQIGLITIRYLVWF